MLGSDNLLSRHGIEMNTIWEPMIKKERTLENLTTWVHILPKNSKLHQWIVQETHNLMD